jgi:hypothetical protein
VAVVVLLFGPAAVGDTDIMAGSSVGCSQYNADFDPSRGVSSAIHPTESAIVAWPGRPQPEVAMNPEWFNGLDASVLTKDWMCRNRVQ